MPLITMLPSGESIDVAEGTSLADACRQAGVPFNTPCGGEGTCGKCVVRIVAGRVVRAGSGALSPAAAADGYALACRTRVSDAAVTVDVPEQLSLSGSGAVGTVPESNSGDELAIDEQDYDPSVVKKCIAVPPACLEDGLSDLGRLRRCLAHLCGGDEIVFPLPVIRAVPDALRAKDGLVTVTVARENGCRRIIAVEPGDTAARLYGLAVDLGTTTVAVRLVLLPFAKDIETVVDFNEQTGCGLDVISRINYAGKGEGLAELARRARCTINRLVQDLAQRHEIAQKDICSAVVSGNTTMVHLLLGIKPEYIRLEPYTPAVLEGVFFSAGDIGLEINPESRVYFSPAVGSYVGGDISAGLLCTELAQGAENPLLFIDVGTNGELAVGNDEFLMGCACSAGPAFEGGGIGCGMPAFRGAINQVEIDGPSGEARVSTIGAAAPRGICGSGIISLLAGLFLAGWVDPGGKLERGRKCSRISISGRHASYTVVAAEESATKSPIMISEKDFENVIRAKAAIYSACCLILEQLGMGFEDLERICIAGGFGRFLDLENAIAIGLLPDLPRDRFVYLGNASLKGSNKVLVSEVYRKRQAELAARMTYLELSTTPSYMDQYTGALFLPHTDARRFPSVKRVA